jgi:hypothetical protein
VWLGHLQYPHHDLVPHPQVPKRGIRGFVSKKDRLEKADRKLPGHCIGIRYSDTVSAGLQQKSLDPALVRHFTAGNPRYINRHRGFGIFAPRLPRASENNPKQH